MSLVFKKEDFQKTLEFKAFDIERCLRIWEC